MLAMKFLKNKGSITNGSHYVALEDIWQPIKLGGLNFNSVKNYKGAFLPDSQPFCYGPLEELHKLLEQINEA